MTVAYDAQSTTSFQYVSSPQTFTHTPSGTPRGIWVGIAEAGDGNVDEVTAVSYGGVALTQVPGSEAVDTITETGRAHSWFLGSSIPTGAQSVSITWASGGSDTLKAIWCVSLTASADTEVIDVDIVQADVDDPSMTLSAGSATGIALGVAYSGVADATANSALTGNTMLTGAVDTGNWGHCALRQTTPATGNHTLGFATAASDDVAFSGVMISEVVAASGQRDPLGMSGFFGG